MTHCEADGVLCRDVSVREVKKTFVFSTLCRQRYSAVVRVQNAIDGLLGAGVLICRAGCSPRSPYWKWRKETALGHPERFERPSGWLSAVWSYFVWAGRMRRSARVH